MSRTQMPLALHPPRRPGFGNFLGGANAAVVRTLRAGLEAGGWYFLGGPAGSGRSHLLAATFDRLRDDGLDAQLVGLGESRYRPLIEHAGGDWVLLDDVDAVAGHDDEERRLFNALNRWRAERTGVIMAGRGRDRFELPDLRSRLGQATRLTVTPLDEEGLAELVRQLAAGHEVPLGRGTVDYILSRAPRSAGYMVELMEACARQALAERRTVSVPLVREAMSRDA